MAASRYDRLVAPISPEQPCGPDLWLEGDADYSNFEARVEGVLPKSFSDFDRTAVDIPAEVALADRISGRCRDIRILSPLAKLLILDRDIAGFTDTVSAIATLLKDYWPQFHPPYEGGESCFRTIAVRALDDLPHTVLPLQSAPLFKTRRFGVVTHRTKLLLDGDIKPRKAIDEDEKDEKVPSAADFRGAINDVELPDLVSIRDTAARLKTAVADIEATFDSLASEGVVRLKKLRPAAEMLFLFLDEAVFTRDPAQAIGGARAATTGGEDDSAADEESQPGESRGIASSAEAMAAIKAAFAFFDANEPASPARLWLAQALSLSGKSFFDSLRALVPDYASQATVKLARELPLTLSVERLADILAEVTSESENQGEETDQGEETESSDDWSEQESGEDAESSADESNDGSDETGEGDDAASSSGDDDQEEPAASEPPRTPRTAEPRKFQAANRNEAVRLIENAAVFIRTGDPSSALPLLLDQARQAVGRDFLSLLRDVLPPNALRIDE